jgi:hypothetical protein
VTLQVINPFQWIGVDLDGTLAYYDGWNGAHHIGRPVKRMRERVLAHMAAGDRVKIFTARATKGRPEYDEAIAAIEKWCLKYLGQVLEITNEKDFGCIRIYDDRAVQIEMNTGRRVDGLE